MLIAPSLLSANFLNLEKEIRAIEQAGADWLHYDVMDGHFVPNISFGYKILSDITPHTNLFIDTHLMVEEPFYLLESFVKAGTDLVTIHLEAVSDPLRYLKEIHRLGVKAGLSIKPDTAVEELIPYLDELDMVLLMSVYPGFGGQSFLEDSHNRLKTLVSVRNRLGKDFLIQMDGGIGPDNAHQLFKEGCDVLVAGSAVFGKPDYTQAIQRMREVE